MSLPTHPDCGRACRACFTSRFLPRVDRGGGCWLWTGALNGDGYGSFKMAGKVRNAHRVAYEQFVGPVPAGLHLDHLCRVRRCVNPAHLEPVTAAENNRRGISPAAVNAAKTKCHRGHSFDSANTYIEPSGKRSCRRCGAAAARRYKARAKGGAA